MTDETNHPADGPEQEITSEASELVGAEAASATPKPATTHDPEGTVPAAIPESELQEEAAPAESNAPAPKLERLQKILAQAGIASRRHAEEMITGGRVQVNGQVVTTLGSKADAARDHIRVDGKLLQGAERQRYFMLNKPRGFVTTVTDPEGRPTVMQFFSKAPERLYPVGRLDYLSEGLLVITNDGELANQLTKAASGVEKTYLVKVAGQPAEEALDRLREGVAIERGRPEENDKVRTAPARIRQVRKGDNPWYEVVIIEGRNRELRKMFEEIGHHVEKIRRVGYGPLVLDVEPGKLRELEPEEVQALRLTAAGKLKPRRPKSTKLLPKDAGKAVSFEDKRGRRVPVRDATRPSKEDRQAYGGGRQSPTAESGARPERPFRPAGDRPIHPTGDRPQRFDRGSQGRSSAPKGSRYPDRSTGRSSSVRSSSSRPGAGRPSYPPRGGEGFASRGPSGPRSYGPPADVPGGFRSGEARSSEARSGSARPSTNRPATGRSGTGRPPADRRDSPRPGSGGFSSGPRGPQRPFSGSRPAGDSSRPPQRPGFSQKPNFRAKPGFSARPDFPKKTGFPPKPGFAPRSEFSKGDSGDKPRPAGKPRLQITPEFDQPSRSGERETPARKPFSPAGTRPAFSGRRDTRPTAPPRDRAYSDRPKHSGTRPPRPDGPARPFRPSSDRPASSSGRPSPGRPESTRSGSSRPGSTRPPSGRPSSGRSASTGSGYRGKPSAGAKRGPGGGGFRGKPSGGAKRSTGRPAGKRSSPVRGTKRPGSKGSSGKKGK